MKLRYLFSMILASALMFVSCVDEMSTESYDNIKLDKTMLVLPVDGGSVELTINATESWAFDTLYTKDTWPNVIKRETDKETNKEKVKSVEPSWLSVDKMAGEAGETVLKFSADTVAGGREIELCIKAGRNSQFIKVRQGSLEASSATCAEVIAGPDGKTYRVKGVVTSIANTLYGNWYLNDGTGEVYVYGTLDKDGKTKNFESWGMEVGDVVEVEGPKLTYGSTVELVDVTVLNIEKSLLKIITEEKMIEKEGGEFEVKLAFKGKGLYPTVDSLSRSWVSIVGVDTYAGTPTKIEPNPADTAIVKFAVAPFEEKAAPRKGAINFKSSLDKATTEIAYNITQKGDLPDPTPIKDATEVDKGICVEGTVVAICSQGYLLADETGVILIYHPETGWENTFVLGDKVKVAADALGAYNFSAQIKNPYFEEKTSEKPVEVTYPAPVNYDAAKVAAVVDALKAAVDPANKEREVALKIEYINMTGKLIIDGKYHNVEIAGSQYQGSLYNPLASLNLADYNGKVVTLGGYFLSISQSSGAFKFINMVVTSVAEAGDVVFPELKFSKTADEVAPEATEYTFDITSNLKWTLAASEGVTLDKTSGEGNATVKMTFAANETEAALVHTVTATAEGASAVTLTLTQATAAAPTEVTVAGFVAAEENATKKYRVQGVVKSVSVNSTYHNANITIAGVTGEEVYLYRAVAAEGNIDELADLKEGAVVTVVGIRSSYNGTPQMASGGVVEKVVSYPAMTVSEFYAAEEGEAIYAVTGEIVEVKDLSESYNNVGIVVKEGETQILLYRAKSFDITNVVDLNLEVGGIVTVAGKRSSYKETPQMAAGGLILSYVAPVTE